MEANVGTDATFHVWRGPVDLAGLAASRLFEHALHTWDVAVAIDPAATVVPEAVAIIVDGLDRVVSFAAKPSPWTGLVRVTTTDPARELALRLGERSSLALWTGAEPGRDPAPAGGGVRPPGLRPPRPRPHPARRHRDGITLTDLRAVFKGI